MNQWGETETRPRHKLFHEGRLFLQQLDGFVPAFSDLGALACPGLPVSIPCQPSAERPFSTMLNAYAESNRPPGVILCFQQLDGFVSTFFPMGPGTLPHLGPARSNEHQLGILRHGESGVPNPPRHFMLSRVFNKLTALFRIFVLGGRAVPASGLESWPEASDTDTPPVPTGVSEGRAAADTNSHRLFSIT